MLIERAYVNERGEALIVCPRCAHTRLLQAAKCRKHTNRIVAKCSCGTVFHVALAKVGQERKRALEYER